MGLISLLLCNMYYFLEKYLFLQLHQNRVENITMVVCVYISLTVVKHSCGIVPCLWTYANVPKCHLLCQINGPVMSFSHIGALDCVIILHIEVMGTMKHEQVTKKFMGVLILEMLRNNGVGWHYICYKGWVGGQNGRIWVVRSY